MINVLYLITSFKEGQGGHFYSLKTIVESLQNEGVNAIVVCIGSSEIIKNGNFKKYMIPISHNTSKIEIQIRDIIIQNKIEFVHLFDFISYRYIMNINIPHIQTKCGGTHNRFIPNSNYITVFSDENLKDFQKRKKYKDSQLIFIPNRINPFECDTQRIADLKNTINYNPKYKYILRITRISKYYEESLRQGYALNLKLNDNNVKSKFLVIGSVYDKNLYNRLKSEFQNTQWITELKFTNNAKELIDICDIYLGTGRGVMEACFCNKLIVVPVQNQKIPALLDQSNFRQFLKFNFSERCTSQIDEKEIFNTIINYVQGNISKKNLFKYYKKEFNLWFNVLFSNSKYINLYKQLQKSKDKGIIKLSLVQGVIFKSYIKYLIIRYAKR